ncbi:MAG TPA: polyribonucleotide nucleotidyltransferase [Phycisphaerae bacterium]|nr:polyribonucleotide nucleotidyltransferase [Phycisphaerae bacterium]
MTTHKVELEVGDRLLSIETGKVAKQANGAVVVQYGDTVILATVLCGKPREGIDFFPLTVDYREKTYAAGKFPGGFYKREGRPTTKEIVTMRMIDRPTRPLFPKDYRDEIQIQCMVLSADQQNDPDILAMIGASAALAISDIPFDGPIGAVRVGRVDGELVVNPTTAQLEESEIELVVVGHKDGVNMLELSGREVPEDVVADAVELGYGQVQRICDVIEQLVAQAGKPKSPFVPPDRSELLAKVRDRAAGPIREAKGLAVKQEKAAAVEKVYEQVLEEFSPAEADEPPYERSDVQVCLDQVEEEVVRDYLLNHQQRPDGRGTAEVRPITCEVGVLPRTHGSSIFTRGETQSLVVTTLGTVRDEQIVDGLNEEYSRKFILQYNFPPFCVGEIRRIVGPSRRDIGHGALAEKSMEAILPDAESFPYTIRVVSDILESNGSSSMATVCGATLSLMDAGVPIRRPVAGVSIGMVSDGERRLLLTDIVGEEDYFGDMDFKVAGTQRGVTGIQLDLKARSLDQETIRAALSQAAEARREILKQMLSVLASPRSNISVYAPRIVAMRINPEKIGKVIGPGGRDIKRIQADTETTIDIQDDGTVTIAASTDEGAEAARLAILGMTEEPEINKLYTGRVISTKDFGAFIEILPGQDGLCHISELSDGYVKNVEDVVRVGDEVTVKVIAIDDQGRVKLSRRQAMQQESAPSDGSRG